MALMLVELLVGVILYGEFCLQYSCIIYSCNIQIILYLKHSHLYLDCVHYRKMRNRSRKVEWTKVHVACV